MTDNSICAHRLLWSGGVRARCNKNAGHDGPHASNILEWTTESANQTPPKYSVIRRRAVAR